ncbi:MAG: hypothetical protein OEZ54_06780 [Gemmatimonadota bacterium]|nr:hypothetical protein [Gemmatimonadota bacterium]
MGRDNALLSRLADDAPLLTVEFRPPQSGLSYEKSMDVWIDMYHNVQRLLQQETFVFLTDNAVGAREEENLSHLAANLASDVPTERVIPFLTSKHSLDYCMLYAQRAFGMGFEALTVLGGDKNVGPPRCVSHAYELRKLIRKKVPELRLGGWINPHADPVSQIDFVLSEDFTADFVLTQVVSHHSIGAVEALLNEAAKRNVKIPMVFGVFLYLSSNPKTLQRLGDFFPVPAREVTEEFEAGKTADEILVRTVEALRQVGANHVYLSNLGVKNVARRYRRIVSASELSL